MIRKSILAGLIAGTISITGGMTLAHADHPASQRVPVDVNVTHKAAHKAAKQGVKPCKSEDDLITCVWDARHRGNGKGQSFVRVMV